MGIFEQQIIVFIIFAFYKLFYGEREQNGFMVSFEAVYHWAHASTPEVAADKLTSNINSPMVFNHGCMLSNVNWYGILFSFSSHRWAESEVAFLLAGLRNECVCWLNRDLNSLAVRPIYAVWVEGVMTLHLYTILLLRHLPRSGQLEGALQLQFRSLEEAVFCARLGVVEYESLIKKIKLEHSRVFNTTCLKEKLFPIYTNIKYCSCKSPDPNQLLIFFYIRK